MLETVKNRMLDTAKTGRWIPRWIFARKRINEGFSTFCHPLWDLRESEIGTWNISSWAVISAVSRRGDNCRRRSRGRGPDRQSPVPRRRSRVCRRRSRAYRRRRNRRACRPRLDRVRRRAVRAIARRARAFRPVWSRPNAARRPERRASLRTRRRRSREVSALPKRI